MPSRLFFILVLGPAALCGCAGTSEREPIYLGYVATLSGPDKAEGESGGRGIELAVTEAADTVRIDGRGLAVLRVDDRGDPATVEAETVRLLTINQAAGLIGGFAPDRAARLARAAQPYKLPVILPGELAEAPPGNAVFTLGVRPAWRGEVLARHAAAELKAKRAAVLTDGRDPSAMALAAAFVKEWRLDEKASVLELTYRDDSDHKEETAALIQARPDVVLIAGGWSDFLKLRGRLASGGLAAPLLFGGEDAGPAEPSAGADVYFATVYCPEGLTEKGKVFARHYQERYHEAPDLAAVQGYDAFRVLSEAMSRAKAPTGDLVRDRLAAMKDFEVQTGPLSFKDGRAHRRTFVVRMTAKATEVVQTVEPEEDAKDKP